MVARPDRKKAGSYGGAYRENGAGRAIHPQPPCRVASAADRRPPARIFPSSPCVAKRSSASSTVRGAKYLNETGFISDEHAKRPSQQIKRRERSDRERLERQRESNRVPCCRGLFLAHHDGRTVVTGQLPTGYRRATRRGIQLPDWAVWPMISSSATN
jgi:hypothetical protein